MATAGFINALFILCWIPAAAAGQVCITNCSCIPPPNQTFPIHINVDCLGQPPRDFTKLLAEFLAQFPTNSIRTVNISRANLREIPQSICNLKEVTGLILTNNAISRIDTHCMAGMVNLTNLNLHNNSLIELQDGLFTDTQSLFSVDMGENLIEHIGVHVFSNASTLTELSNLILSHNRLTSIDPWPMVRLLVRPGTNIDIEYNNISQFTYNMMWHYNCTMPRLEGEITLKSNQIHRISDIYHGWHYPTYFDIICMFLGKSFEFSLQFNPYHCDCHEYWPMLLFTQWGSRSRIIPQFICHTPTFPGLGPDPKMIRVPLIYLQCDIQDGCPQGCQCIQRPHNRTFHIICADSSFRTLPISLPYRIDVADDIKYQYKLEFYHTKLVNISARNYLAHSTIIDMSGSQVENLADEAVPLIVNASSIFLHSNRLASLPRTLEHVNLSASSISLHDNPWICDCHSLWLKHWMFSIKDRLMNPSGILCGSPKRAQGTSMLSLADEQFICGDPPDNRLRDLLLISTGSILGTVMLFIIPLVTTYILRIWIFVKFNWHPFDWDECDGEEMTYDVFVSYADPNEEWMLQLLSWLEDVHGYRCCVHKRDFLPGMPIADNISQAISRSRRIICIVSEYFIESQFCLWELDLAIHQDVTKRKRRLILIKLGELPPVDQLPVSLRNHMKTFTYLDSSHPKFNSKMKYVLPVHRLESNERVNSLDGWERGSVDGGERGSVDGGERGRVDGGERGSVDDRERGSVDGDTEEDGIQLDNQESDPLLI